MELTILKRGNLMGSPDIKKLLQRAGPGSHQAHELFVNLHRIKLYLGQNGQATSALVTQDDDPKHFPALIDFSYISTDPASTQQAGQQALHELAQTGYAASQIKSLLYTHPHPDHFDESLLAHFPQATIYLPGSNRRHYQSPEAFGGAMQAFDTPGHGTAHTSYLFRLEALQAACCFAGDLIMSQAHYLSLDHPLSFSDHSAGKKSIAKIMRALHEQQLPYNLIFPGHGEAFFATQEDWLRWEIQ